LQAKLTNREETPGLLVCEFESEPGFSFQPGEYIQIVLEGGDKRYFSVMSSPKELPRFKIGTRPSESVFKKTLRSMKFETEVQINGPWGDLVLPYDSKERSYYFVAGGIGVTPFLSMIKYKTELFLPYELSLLYFCGGVPLFKFDLENWANQSNKTRILFIHEPISADTIKRRLVGDYAKSIFMVAGPPGFVNKVLNILQEIGIQPQNIVHESYTGYN